MSDACGREHIEIKFQEGAVDVTQRYAVEAEILHRAKKECAGQSPVALRAWLEAAGAVPDRCVAVWPDGLRMEEKRRAGKPHCDDAAARVTTWPDGSCLKEWYRDGKRVRADGGPARAMVWADGARRNEWYSKGEFLRSEDALPVRPLPALELHAGAPQP